MGGQEASIRKIRGDGLSVRLQSNEQVLEVTGDGCSVTVTMNYGSVKIIGDGCRLRIERNMGDVEYTGDGGRVLLGAKSVSEKVKYIGDGGRVSFDGEPRTKTRKPKSSSKEAKRPAGRVVQDAKDHEEECQNREGSNRERMENLSNEKKDTEWEDRKKERRGRGGSSRTRIVTTFDYGEKIAKKWLANPVTIVRNLDGVSFARVEPKRATIVVK